MDEAVLRAQKWLNATYKGKTGYTLIDEDGITGQGTFKALIIALQIEIGISAPNGTFGPQTTSLCPTLSKNVGASANNKVMILQHGLFCKGYSTKSVTGVFGDNTEGAVKDVEADAGFVATGVVTPLIFKAILNTDPLVLSPEGSSQIRYIQQQLNKNYHAYFDIVPTNGIYERNTNKALIYALQAEEGLGVGTANGSFGPTTQNRCPVLRLNDTRSNFVKILQYALQCNNFSVNNMAGTFNDEIKQNIIDFQSFVALPDNGGAADLDVWMSLLTSKGNTNRAVTGCDCATVIRESNVNVLVNNGYNTIGRYLIGLYKLTKPEITVLANNNIRIFPIFQRSGEGASATNIGYFTATRAAYDAYDAYSAARNLGFRWGTIIYFAVDFDAYDAQVTNTIIPFFEILSNSFRRINATGYRIGIYGPRNVCSRVWQMGYTVSSFVSDMSTAYSGNLGYPMPTNWAFDQIVTVTISDSGKSIEIDKDVVRGTYLGELFPKVSQDEISLEDATVGIVELMGMFEGGNGYQNIAGNFDGQGLSLGIIQFNIGRGTLQPILQEMLTNHRAIMESVLGKDKTTSIENMLQLSLSQQLSWAVGINDGNVINNEWEPLLIKLAGTVEFIALQNKNIREGVMVAAVDKCNIEGLELKTNRGFCVMFEISVHNGGFQQIEIDDIRGRFIENASELDKLAIIAERMGYYRGADSLSRISCIVNGNGTVHGIVYENLEEKYGINNYTVCELNS